MSDSMYRLKVLGNDQFGPVLDSAGVPIEGVGLQGHFIVGSLYSNIAGTIQAYANLDVEVAITELDIRMTLPADEQKRFTDKFIFLGAGYFLGPRRCVPNLNKRPAYDGILAGWSV
ncbi:hypothetical protein ACEPAG_7462 [Sanghuangporus baumii]